MYYYNILETWDIRDVFQYVGFYFCAGKYLRSKENLVVLFSFQCQAIFNLILKEFIMAKISSGRKGRYYFLFMSNLWESL